MNKSIKIVIGILIGLLILWGIIFAIDYNRCSNMKEPIFAISKKENDLSIKSITYQCLGYRVEVVKNVSDEYGEQITKVEMYMFNKFIAGAIANSNTNEETIDNDIVIIKNGNINDEDLINDFINKVNDSSNYRKEFDLTYYQRKDMGLEKIIDNKENDNYDFDVYTFGGDVSITIDSDMVFDLKEALEQNIITVDKIIEQCKIDEEYGICFSNFYKDGGSIEYCYNNYTILKYNTLDGNKDLVIGFKGQIINMVNEKINI